MAVSVMLVDDEKILLDDLFSIFDWEANGFQIIATARNGKDGIAKFNKFHPQIVISDIKMPIMDGLTMLNQIRSIDKNCKFLILTAYGEFDYAIQAIKLGLTDYFIKNKIHKPEFSKKLLSIKENIQAENELSHLALQQIVIDYLNSNLPDSPSYVGSVRSNIFTLKYYFLIFEPDPILFGPPNHAGGLFKLDISNAFLTSHLSAHAVEFVCHIEDARVLVLLAQKANHSTESHLCRSDIAVLIQEAKPFFPMRFSVYVSETQLCFSDFRDQYKQLKKAFLERIFFPEDQTVFDFSFLLKSPEKCNIAIDKSYIMQLIESGDDESLQCYLNEIFFIIKKHRDAYSLLSTLKTIKEIFRDQYNHNILTSHFDDSIFNTSSMYTFDDAYHWLCSCISQVIEYKAKDLSKTYSAIVQNTLLFINRNYCDPDLTIQQIAENHFVSPNYLSTIFKKETGTTVLNYITDLRMQKAKSLLKTSPLPIGQISVTCGYSSPQYFSQAFFKYYNETPRVYRDDIQSRQNTL
ncbi:DNA-binding response regulator [Clostridia bacterium]|nr:DNA-binding response regulator [Clostridia bacterium]